MTLRRSRRLRGFASLRVPSRSNQIRVDSRPFAVQSNSRSFARIRG